MAKAFLFDFDGVIVDSERYWRGMDDTFFPSVAPQYNADDAREMMGLGLHDGFSYLQRRGKMNVTLEEYTNRLERAVVQVYAEQATILPGIEALMQRVRAIRFAMGIASSSRRIWIETALNRFALLQRFDAIASADEVQGKTKPDPAVYLHAAKQLQVAPAQCIALEDSDHGISAARNAGMQCIGLRTDMNDHQKLSGATVIVPSPDAITAELLRSL